jgi:hypothetical protein
MILTALNRHLRHHNHQHPLVRNRNYRLMIPIRRSRRRVFCLGSSARQTPP